MMKKKTESEQAKSVSVPSLVNTNIIESKPTKDESLATVSNSIPNKWHTPVSTGLRCEDPLAIPEQEMGNKNLKDEDIDRQLEDVDVETTDSPDVEIESIEVNSKNKKPKKPKQKTNKDEHLKKDTQIEASLVEVHQRLNEGCECTSSCFENLIAEDVYKHRLNIAELTKEEHDMYLMGVTMASLANRQQTHRNKERLRQRASYVFQGKRVCLDAFLYLENVTQYHLKIIRNHLLKHGVTTRVHGNVGKKPYNTFSLDMYKSAESFVKMFIETHTDGSKPFLIIGETRKSIYDKFRDNGDHPDGKIMGFSTFRHFFKKQFPNVKFAPKIDELRDGTPKKSTTLIKLGTHIQQKPIEQINFSVLHSYGGSVDITGSSVKMSDELTKLVTSRNIKGEKSTVLASKLKSVPITASVETVPNQTVQVVSVGPNQIQTEYFLTEIPVEVTMMDQSEEGESIQVDSVCAASDDAFAALPTSNDPKSITASSTSPLHQSHQRLFQHQSSVTSTASVQTVFHQQTGVLSSSSGSVTGINGGSGSSVNGNTNFPISSSNISFQSGNNHINSCSGSITCLVSNNGSASYLQGQMMTSSDPSIAEEILSIGDVADLLHPQYAIITGGRSNDGCSLITFPDHNNFHALGDTDYQKLILYLTSVPSVQDAEYGFNLIVDRRKDRWTSVKTVLLKISGYFPGIIHVVYVLRPSGFFQKAISEVSSKFFKDEFKFKLIVCASLADLYEHIDKSQLTHDLGGDLIYSHHEWIQQRISLEKFSGLTHQVTCSLDAFMRVIHDTEFPNSVEATQKLLDEQGLDYDRLKEDILAAAKHGEQLLENFKSDVTRELSERINGNINTTERPTPGITTLSVEPFDDSRDYRRLLIQLEETERRFDEFWNTHLTRLKQCLDLRRFEQDFRELQSNFDSHLKTVSEMTEIGETVSRVDTLIKETKTFQTICNSDIERAEEVVSTGQQLISVRGACPKEVVQPKCDELSRVCDIVTERLSRRLEILLKSRDLMERVEKANKWCARGVELLASQRIEKCSVSVEIAEQSLQEIQQFIASASEFRVSSPREFRNVFQECTTPETKALVTQVLQRIDDVSLMCDKRVVSLKKLTLKPPRPVQQVTPEPAVPLQPPGGAPHLFRIRQQSQGRRMDSIDSRPRSMEGPLDSGISISGDNISSPDSDNSSNHAQSQSDSEARKLKRGHVLAELLETERIYVAEMGSILKGYRDQILSEDLASLVPPGLQDKEDILFGNLHELFTFHNEVFLKDLENCISTTELVALCFVQRRDTFYRLYSYYCQNIPRSERLRETLVDTHLFLQECQKRLGHKLPLAAYLLKPVQRITKYQLLLKDLLRFSDSGTCARELQKALDCMLIVLKCVNDSMHQIAITGFPADLTQQGELLLQDSFQVWTESKKDLRLRLKTQQRHIFLYQKAMLFCKQASKTGHNKSTYQFKHYVKMSQIGLTESVRGDARRFEVWLQGRQEVHTIQAVTIEIKNKWVAEIKRVLLNQLEELKGEKIKQYGLSHRPLRQTVSWDTPMAAAIIPPRTLSCDNSEPNRCSNASDEAAPMPSAISNSSSSEHDNHETWSSDYSNSEDEFSTIDDTVTPGTKFISLADYCAMGHSEVTMKEGDTVELLKVGCAGWWFVKVLGVNIEGWAPAAYLEPINKKIYRNGKNHKT